MLPNEAAVVSLAAPYTSPPPPAPSPPPPGSLLGDGKSSPGDAESSLGDGKSSLGDAESFPRGTSRGFGAHRAGARSGAASVRRRRRGAHQPRPLPAARAVGGAARRGQHRRHRGWPEAAARRYAPWAAFPREGRRWVWILQSTRCLCHDPDRGASRWQDSNSITGFRDPVYH